MLFHFIPPSLHFVSTAAPAPQIYSLSLHDALPISIGLPGQRDGERLEVDHGLAAESAADLGGSDADLAEDRKSTRLNSSHLVISYAVFSLKKKQKRTESDWYTLLFCPRISQCFGFR